MITVKQMTEMFDLQDSLNNKTCGADWKTTGKTDTGRTLDFMKAFRLELAEAIDSTNWKWWKSIDAEDDIENIKIEVTDMWHFLMAYLMITYPEVDNKLHAEGAFSFAGQANEADIGDNDTILTYLDDLERVTAVHHAIPVVHHYIHADTGVDFSEVPEEGKTEHEVISKLRSYGQYSIVNLVSVFFSIVESIEGFGTEGLYKLYIGKNVLNTFRQDHGYKEGTYVKMWGGVEDNVIMQKLLNTNDIESAEDMTELLEIEYAKVVAKDHL